MGRRIPALLLSIAGALAFAEGEARAVTLDEATRLFEGERWEAGAIALEEVSRTGTAYERDVAQWELGIALYRMGFPNASFGVLSSIADRPNHPRFAGTLVWMVKLALELPEAADVIERVAKWDESDRDRFTRVPETGSRLRYLLGREHYASGRFAIALNELAAIDRSSTTYVKGRFFCAAANVQLRRSAPATACLEEALAASAGDGDAKMRDLAHLSLARTLYSDSFRLGKDLSPTIDREKLGAAIAAWDAVTRGSDLWLDALAEQAWALFMQRDDARALGNLHTLDAPFFEAAYFPEAQILRSLIYVTNCQWEDATTTALAFQRRYLPLADELERTLTRLDGDDADARALALVEGAAEGRSVIAPTLRPVAQRLAGDRALGRQVDYVRAIDAERARVSTASPALRAAPLGSALGDMLQLARDIALRDLGRLVRARLRGERSELDGFLRASANMLIAVPTLMTQPGGAPSPAGGTSPGAAKAITVDQEHVKWPFDGEFWRDELGFYRQAVRSDCRR